jgi:hypothetical protein
MSQEQLISGLVALVAGLLAGIILLYIEYAWFANHFPQVFGKKEASPKPAKDTDWGNVIAQVKLGLIKIYPVSIEQIDIREWKKIDGDRAVELQVRINYGIEARKEKCDYVVVASEDGRIISSDTATAVSLRHFDPR